MTQIFDIHPAFGFDTSVRSQIAISQRNDYNKGQGSHAMWVNEIRFTNNLAKVLSYVPVLNIITGIARIIFNSDLSKNPLKRAIELRHIKRGVMEIFLGPVLLVVDIAKTIVDQKKISAYLDNK